jgi:hypothetical protein
VEEARDGGGPVAPSVVTGRRQREEGGEAGSAGLDPALLRQRAREVEQSLPPAGGGGGSRRRRASARRGGYGGGRCAQERDGGCGVAGVDEAGGDVVKVVRAARGQPVGRPECARGGGGHAQAVERAAQPLPHLGVRRAVGGRGGSGGGAAVGGGGGEGAEGGGVVAARNLADGALLGARQARLGEARLGGGPAAGCEEDGADQDLQYPARVEAMARDRLYCAVLPAKSWRRPGAAGALGARWYAAARMSRQLGHLPGLGSAFTKCSFLKVPAECNLVFKLGTS